MKAIGRFPTRIVLPVVVAAAVVAAVALLGRPSGPSAETQPVASDANFANGLLAGAGGPLPKFINPATYVFPVQLTKKQWKARLTPAQYFILRDKGTDPPFHNAYWNNHRSGIYYSAATGQPLFSSKDKFDSGTGWPSFTKPINPNAVVLDIDNSLGMQRVEVLDSLSGSHLGHLFNDGPPPTHLRYCMDSTALIFVPTGGTPPPLITTELALHSGK